MGTQLTAQYPQPIAVLLIFTCVWLRTAKKCAKIFHHRPWKVGRRETLLSHSQLLPTPIPRNSLHLPLSRAALRSAPLSLPSTAKQRSPACSRRRRHPQSLPWAKNLLGNILPHVTLPNLTFQRYPRPILTSTLLLFRPPWMLCHLHALTQAFILHESLAHPSSVQHTRRL